MARVTHEGFKRLTDPNYVPDLARPTPAPTAAELALPSLAELVDSGALPPGTLVTALDAEGELIAEITEDGQLMVDEHAYSSPDRAVHEHGSDAGDGWSYWLAHLGGDPIPLEALRESAAERRVGAGHGT